METQGGNTIASWTPGQLVRFIQNMMREHPPESANTLKVENMTVIKKLTCSDQTQIMNLQTTVGAAGTASALPAAPKGYFKFLDYAGNVVVVPYYAAS